MSAAEQQMQLASSLHRAGVTASQAGNAQLALQLIWRAIEINPANAAACCDLGSAFQRLNHVQGALAGYDRAIALRPDFTEAHFNKGNLLMSLGRWEEALASFDSAISIRPFAEAFLNRGIVLKALGRLQAALASFESVIAIDGRCAEALSNRGVLLLALGQYEASLVSFDQAIAIKPQYAEAHGNKGNALKALNGFDEALRCYDRAIELKNTYPEAHSSRGVALAEMRRYDEAFASFETAVALKPDYAEAYLNRAMASLMLGRFDTGWVDFEWRHRCAEVAAAPAYARFEQPAWRGDAPLSGRSILLWWEQGLGDTLQFCRYAERVADLGATVILETQPQLTELLQTLPRAVVLKSGDPRPRFDYQCPLMSLPLAFGTTLSTIPCPGRYLRADPARVEYWRDRLGRSDTPRIGLVWSGSQAHKNDRNRSLSLSLLLPFLPPAIQYISLQVDVRESDRETLNLRPDILDCSESLRSFADTAALCECLDLVVAVDTSVAHLSAAIGQQTWVLLPYTADWRWLLNRTDSPWYETMRLYRQDVPGDWAGALTRLRDDLSQRFFTDEMR